MNTLRGKVFLATAAAALLGVQGFAAPAAAAPTCSFDAGTATVTVSMSSDDTATVRRSGDAIQLDGSDCGNVTVSNTDTIVVDGTGTGNTLVIDLSGGPFAPGASTEDDGGDAEIEFTVDLGSGTPAGALNVIGTGDADTIVLGADGLNLNAAESVGDTDVTTTNTFTFKVDARAGNDEISGEGGAGTGGRLDFGLTALGRTGDDRLSGSAGVDTLDGGDGKDTVDYSGEGAIQALALPDGSVTTNEGADALTSIENVTGSPEDDLIVGSKGANELRGFEGSDVIAGMKGNDRLFGGLGKDTVDFLAAEQGVTVDLTNGTATGEGKDELRGFEGAGGSNHADLLNGSNGGETFLGRAGADVINGLAGADWADGGKGDDDVLGGSGPDELYGGPNDDLVDGGSGQKDRCRGNHGADTIVNCEL